MVQVIKCLGHRVTEDGLAPDPSKVEALHGLPMLTNVSQFRSLRGTMTFYRKFLSRMVAKTKPLNVSLGKDVKLAFMAEHVAIVQGLLKRLASPHILALTCGF